MKKKYTHIFFDLDNTLWDFKTNSYHAMQITFRHFKLEDGTVGFDRFFEVYSRHNHDLWEKYRNKEIKKKELTTLRFQLTFEELGLSGIDPQEMNDKYLSEMPCQTFLIDGAEEILKKLKSAGFSLFIITNGFVEVQHKKMESSGLKPYFDKVFISEDLKVPKPGREIFDYAIKSANAKKSNSLMVGDDWEVDIAGALNAGIDAVYYSPDKNDEENESAHKNSKNRLFVIHELTQIISKVLD